MEELNVRYTPEQWVEHYQRNYLDTLTLDTATRIIKNDMTNMARTCVSIGFHLKAVRDKELYCESGYENIWNYAAEQFGLSMSSASRYMTVNDMFSVGGNTPQLQDEYRNFSKSQLQEMITMSVEQRQMVTEDMTVKEIRAIKNPKTQADDDQTMGMDTDAMADVPIPGQMNIQDYPEVLPEQAVATSQISISPEREQVSAYGLPARTYSPESLIQCAGCGTKETGGMHDCFSCHMDGCQIRQEECWCVEAPCGNPFPCTTLNVMENIRVDIGDRCQFVNHDLADHRAGDGEPVPCCKKCDEPCGYECRRSIQARNHKKHIVAEESDTQEHIDSSEDVYSLSDYQLLESELSKAHKLLTDMLNCYEEDDDLVRRQKILVGALANMKSDLDEAENIPEESEQPEFPVLKNNDQRQEWVKNYKTWGLWYRDEHIDVNYYKFDFEDGTRLIASEYPQREVYWSRKRRDEVYYHLLEKNARKYGEAHDVRYDKQFCHQTSCMTEITDYLKRIRKSGRS